MASVQLLNKLILLDKLIIDRRRGSPLHLQIQRTLRELIDLHFEDGDAFFTEAELVQRLGISRPTIRQALGELNREGLLLRRPSIGTIITKVPTSEVSSAHIGASVALVPSETRPSQSPKRLSYMGVFLPAYDSEILAMLLQKIVEESHRRDLPLQTYYTHRGDDLKRAYKQVGHGPDDERFILMDSSLELSRALWESGYRTVTVDAQEEDYSGASVETDAAMAAQMGVDYLWSLGHERITFLANEPEERRSVQEKIAQFRRALPTGRVISCGTRDWENSFEAAYARMGDVWAVSPAQRPTAVMTASDAGAWAALRWFAERGVSVPGTVSVLGFEDARSSRFMHPALSSLAHPVEAQAQAAFDMLWGINWNPTRLRLAPSLIIRDSTGAVPRARLRPGG